MVYKDACAAYDNELIPAERPGEPCVNCRKLWTDHKGWACMSSAPDRRFSKITPGLRYLTESMKQSLMSTPVANPFASIPTQVREQPKKPAVDISDWRAWRHNVPGDCPCGIARTRCDYHR